ncbi:4a-hydroxytetrahydrobiopterin dehydratase [Citricoccus nitrophenolicus]|uniref:4a-hydroxytetrahydrobiopterin dehydratase n=1 Tax=Citricoccus nitrophenolicus TaxID=863575 RepID=UPI0031E6AD5C
MSESKPDPKKTLTSDEIAEAGLDGWTEDGGTLTATFATKSFATGLELVNLIGASAEENNHHPDLLLTYPSVQVTWSSHDVGGITSRDVRLARATSGHAEALGVTATE